MVSLALPSGTGPLVAAVQWLQATLLGTIATTVAILAVASVGAMMLTGRIDIRRGVSVVVGCFILFSASTIVGGLQGVATDIDPRVATFDPPSFPPPTVQRSAPRLPSRSFDDDPYAGAAVSRR